jgi:hypothetical protein
VGFLMMQAEIIALFTGFFSMLALFLFIRGFIKGTAKPYLWAWAIRILICIVAFFSQLSQGATYSLALAFSQILCCAVIIGLTLYAGSAAGKLDKADWTALAIAGLGVICWLASGDSTYSIVGVILADACASVMGIRAAVKKGARESIPFWVCAFMAASLAVGATGGATWTIVAVPLFSCVNAGVNISIAMYMKYKSEIFEQSRMRFFLSIS